MRHPLGCVSKQPGSFFQEVEMRIYSPPIPLSEKASIILDEVESLYGKEVRWQERSDLEGGDMRVLRHTSFPIVQYKNISVVNENGCVHELLHLKLGKLGFPGLKRVDRKDNDRERDVLIVLLNDLFEHALIFPELVQMGYNTFEAEDKGTNTQLTQILKPNFLSSDCSTLLRNYCASLYARVHLECRSQEVIDKCDSIFAQEEFHDSKALGLRVIEIVRQYAINDVSLFRAGLMKCIFALQESEFIQLDP
jgi:hypothetical protein